jgi:hypothetical protein
VPLSAALGMQPDVAALHDRDLALGEAVENRVLILVGPVRRSLGQLLRAPLFPRARLSDLFVRLCQGSRQRSWPT